MGFGPRFLMLVKEAVGPWGSPPPSTPSAAGQMPAATAAAEPPDEPPDALVLSYGLRVALRHRNYTIKHTANILHRWAHHIAAVSLPQVPEQKRDSNLLFASSIFQSHQLTEWFEDLERGEHISHNHTWDCQILRCGKLNDNEYQDLSSRTRNVDWCPWYPYLIRACWSSQPWLPHMSASTSPLVHHPSSAALRPATSSPLH